MNNISELLNNLPTSIKLEKAKGIKALVQISLSGEGGGDWSVNVDDGTVDIQQGLQTKPDLIIKAKVQDALDLMDGKGNPVTAYMTGKIKVVGDIGLAMKLLGLLK